LPLAASLQRDHRNDTIAGCLLGMYFKTVSKTFAFSTA